MYVYMLYDADNNLVSTDDVFPNAFELARVVFDTGKACVECGNEKAPLYRATYIPAHDNRLVMLGEMDRCGREVDD